MNKTISRKKTNEIFVATTNLTIISWVFSLFLQNIVKEKNSQYLEILLRKKHVLQNNWSRIEVS